MRELLLDLYFAAVRAADPEVAVRQSLAEHPLPSPAPVHLFAIGKAGPAMARAALSALISTRHPLAGGVVIGASAAPAQSSLPQLSGDHPVPGEASALAAEALGRAVNAVAAMHQAVVLVSGGTSSLVGAPVDRIEAADLRLLWQGLLASGLDIRGVNNIRKRCLRWGAGRLASALTPRPVTVLAISDVIGDDPATIGSGPCAPDPLRAREVLSLVESVGGSLELPGSVRRLLERQAAGLQPDTPKPGDAAFRNVSTRIIASNRLAVQGAARRAAELGLPVRAGASDLAGEARLAGARLGAFLRAGGSGASCFIWGGETTVTLGGGPAGTGGRCQELALAAAEELDGVPGVSLLAAGTDGRDGPSDVAGALVDGGTWKRIIEQGRDPGGDLAAHDAYAALDAGGALLRTGATGTNVMDVVIGLRHRAAESPGG